MICKNCGQIVFSRSKQGVCKNCTTAGRVKEKKIYDRKVWKKFDIGIQEKLTEQYEIILVGKTLKEKVKGVFKRSDKDKRKERREKITKIVKKIIKGSTSKSGGNKMSKLARALNQSAPNNMMGITGKTNVGKDYTGLFGNGYQRDYSGLISKRKDIKL